MKFIPYLNFDGNAEEVITYYKEVFKGEITSIMRFSDHPEIPVPDDYVNNILHAELLIKDAYMYFSDTFPGTKVSKGDQISVLIEFDTLEEIERVYAELSNGLDVFMPIEDTFWNARFASLVDKYGISWSLNYAYPDK